MRRASWNLILAVAACGTPPVDGHDGDSEAGEPDHTDAVDTERPAESDVDTDTDVPGGDLDGLAPGALVVTEILPNPAACDDAKGEYVELRNTTEAPIDLRGLVLQDDVGSFTVAERFVVAAGARVVVARDPEGLLACYGVTADLAWDRDLNETNDRVRLSTPGGVALDEIALRQLLGTRYAFAPPGVAFERDDDASGTWCPASTSLGGTRDVGSPGLPNGACGGAPVDTDTDAGSTGLTLADLGPDDLSVTEVMLDPGACGKATGQYVEVLYEGLADADLKGLVLSTGGATSTALGTLLVSPGERFVLGRSIGLCPGWSRSATALLSGVTLSADEEIRIGDGTRVLDLVDTTGWAGHGVAWERDDADASRWCPADAAMGTSTDLGSPRVANGTCPSVDTDVVDTDTVLHLEDLGPGDVVVTEFMADPADCSPDPEGEWIELQYLGPGPADLGGLAIGNGRNVDTLPSPLLVQPGDLVLAVNNRVTPVCHGLLGVGMRNVTLRNAAAGGDTIRLFGNGTTFDTVDYTGRVVPEGTALQRDAEGAWCAATTLIGTPPMDSFVAKDVGTPGRPNLPCAAVDTADTDPGDTTQPLVPAELRVGDLRVTEVMADPEACPNADGQYVEVLYLGSRAADLRGLRVGIGRGTPVAPTFPATVQPGARLVLARDATGYAACYGLTADVDLGVGLAVSGDTIHLLDDHGRQLESLATGVARVGAALERDDADPTLACAADTSVHGTIDLGSPGLANGLCGTGDPVAGRRADDLVAGEVRLTEVMARPSACGATAEYVELRYQGSGTVDLDGLVVTLGSDVVVVSGAHVVAKDERVLLGRTDGGVAACYGVAPDALAAFDLDDAGFAATVWTPDGDVLAEATIGASTPGVAREEDDVVHDRWCAADTRAGTSTDQGTPRAANGACPATALLSPDELASGDLVVTEWMPDPAACADADAEYLEVVYQGAAAADLKGLVVDYGGVTTTLSGSLPVTTGRRLLLGRPGTGFSACWGRAPDATLGFLMGDTAGARLVLRAPGGTVLASVALASLPPAPGTAWELDEATGLWCEADAVLANGDHGSPGVANGACAWDDTGLLPEAGALDVDDLLPGELRVTEILADPTAAIDGWCEYVEILSLADAPVDLIGLRVQDDEALSPVLVTTSKVLAPGERALLVPDPLSFPTCYGLRGIGIPGIALGNVAGDLVRLANAGGVLDVVDFRGPRVPAGRSLTLDEADDVWCATPSTSRIGTTSDAGTPGVVGPACP